MPRTHLFLAGALALTALAAPAAHAQYLTFDDIVISGAGAAAYRANLPAPYFGFTFAPAPGSTDQGVALGGAPFLSGTGYPNQVVSGSNIFYSIFGASITRATPFTFNDGYFGTPFKQGATLTVRGFRLGVEQFTTSFTVNATGPTFRTFGWANVDRLSFSVSGGTELYGATDYLTADNLRFDNAAIPGPPSTVPEPATVVLLAGGLAMLGVIRARGRRA